MKSARFDPTSDKRPKSPSFGSLRLGQYREIAESEANLLEISAAVYHLYDAVLSVFCGFGFLFDVYGFFEGGRGGLVLKIK